MQTYKLYITAALSTLLLSGVVPDEKKPLTQKTKVNTSEKIGSSTSYKQDVISVYNNDAQQQESYIYDKELYELGCDTLPQVKFWRSIMHLTKDSALLCYSNQRCVI